jgi:hypothetical protein
VIHACGILNLVESSLTLRSDVQLTFLQAYFRRNREQSRKVLAQRRPSCLRIIEAGILSTECERVCGAWAPCCSSRSLP